MKNKVLGFQNQTENEWRTTLKPFQNLENTPEGLNYWWRPLDWFLEGNEGRLKKLTLSSLKRQKYGTKLNSSNNPIWNIQLDFCTVVFHLFLFFHAANKSRLQNKLQIKKCFCPSGQGEKP